MVTDTGVGIPQHRQREIFEAFSQADTSTTRRYGGTGLGLTISRQLVELMGGKLWVESAVGVGSTFHFTVRLGRGQASVTPASAHPQHLRGLRVLVVDDNATNRRILQAQLTSWQMQPVLADSGEQALRLLAQAKERGQPFPLIVTDAHMPRMDGFTFVERIRQDPHLASAAIMMLTSADQKAAVERCRQLGIVAYLLKPIKPTELRHALLRTLGQEEQVRRPPASSSLTRTSHHPLHILLAEDNAVNQKLAVRLLQKWGHTVSVANTGKAALAALEHDTFDLVLMDVQMPEMDGLEATAAIRAKERLSRTHLPIVAMTAGAMAEDKERCLAAGMDDYVSKPLKTDELMAILEHIEIAKTDHHEAAPPTPA
jgi:CheY-like chemotaxis protein